MTQNQHDALVQALQDSEDRVRQLESDLDRHRKSRQHMASQSRKFEQARQLAMFYKKTMIRLKDAYSVSDSGKMCEIVMDPDGCHSGKPGDYIRKRMRMMANIETEIGI